MTSTLRARPGLGYDSGPAGTTEPPHAHNPASGVAQAWHDICLKLPISCSLFQVRRNILSLEEKAQRTPFQVGPGIPEQAVKRRTSPRGDNVHSEVEIFRTIVVHGG